MSYLETINRKRNYNGVWEESAGIYHRWKEYANGIITVETDYKGYYQAENKTYYGSEEKEYWLHDIVWPNGFVIARVAYPLIGRTIKHLLSIPWHIETKREKVNISLNETDKKCKLLLDVCIWSVDYWQIRSWRRYDMKIND